MKTKLLKKVRKRFEIIHLPLGFTEYGHRFEYNLFKLIDANNMYFERYVQFGEKEGLYTFCKPDKTFNTESECISSLKQEIIIKLRSEGYLGRKDRVMKKAEKKVWWCVFN